MKIAVVGASGLVGAPVAALLQSRGHEVRRLHRGSADHPVDLRTGAGLRAALAGVEVVVNATNVPPWRTPGRLMIGGTRRLLEASDAHHVCISIVGLEAVAPVNRYYRVKLAQEAAVIASGRPYSIVRSTQFHEYLGGFAMAAARARIELHSRARFAPVSVQEAAAVIARTAAADPTWRTVTLGGPDTLAVTQLRAGRGLWLPLTLGPRIGPRLRSGALIHPQPDVRGVLTYNQWMAEARGRPWRPTPQR